MQCQLAGLHFLAVLEQEHALISTEPHSTSADWNSELRMRQDAFDVSWHVIRPLGDMAVQGSVFRNKPCEEILNVALYAIIDVLLDQDRGRRVADEDSQQPLADGLIGEPSGDFIGHLV